ncbi:hypothetical protein IWQ61_003517 [Dispira simplex]|nr:hypothetical protein IWQ61_003517 [Dispira simplex]
MVSSTESPREESSNSSSGNSSVRVRFRNIVHRLSHERTRGLSGVKNALHQQDDLFVHRPQSFGTDSPTSDSADDVSTPQGRPTRGRNFTLRSIGDRTVSVDNSPQLARLATHGSRLQAYGTFHEGNGQTRSSRAGNIPGAPVPVRSSTVLDIPRSHSHHDPEDDNGVVQDYPFTTDPSSRPPQTGKTDSSGQLLADEINVFDTLPRDDFTPYERFTSDQSYHTMREAMRKQSFYGTYEDDMLPPLKQRLAFYFDTSRAGRIWDLVDVLVNMVFVVVYIWNTQYVTETQAYLPLWAQCMDMGVAMLLLLQFLPRYYLAVDRSRYFMSLMSLGTLLATIPPTVAFFWAQFDQEVENSLMSADILIYLYPLRILRLQLTVFNFLVPVKNGVIAFSAITRKAIRLAGGILFTLLTVSAFVHTVTYTQRKADDPLLDFSEAFFFTTVSSTSGLSTDLVPDSAFTRIVILYIMVVGAIFIPTNLSELLTLMSRQSRYPTHFAPSSHQSHVLLVGKMDSVSLFEFLREFFCEDHGLITVNTVVVIMDDDEPSEDVANILDDPSFANRVKYVRGSPTSFSSLHSVYAHQAKACFLLSNKGHQSVDPETQDATSVMYALAIKKYSRSLNRRLKLYAQVLIPETQTHLEYLATRTICIDELRLGLLAQSCVIPGFASLLHLLTTSITDHTCDQILTSLQDRPRMSWIKEYIRGATQEIYPITFSEFMVGCTFTQAAEVIYSHFGATLFALRIKESSRRGSVSGSGTGKKWRLIINPVHHVLTGGEMGFAIATTSEIAQAISKFGLGYSITSGGGSQAVPPEYQPQWLGQSGSQSVSVTMPLLAEDEWGQAGSRGMAESHHPHSIVGGSAAPYPSGATPGLRRPTLISASSLRSDIHPSTSREGPIGGTNLMMDTSDSQPGSSVKSSPNVGPRKTDLVFMGPSDDEDEEDDGVEMIMPGDRPFKEDTKDPVPSDDAPTPNNDETFESSPAVAQESQNGPTEESSNVSDFQATAASAPVVMTDQKKETVANDSAGVPTPVTSNSRNNIVEKNVKQAQTAAWAEINESERRQVLPSDSASDDMSSLGKILALDGADSSPHASPDHRSGGNESVKDNTSVAQPISVIPNVDKAGKKPGFIKAVTSGLRSVVSKAADSGVSHPENTMGKTLVDHGSHADPAKQGRNDQSNPAKALDRSTSYLQLEDDQEGCLCLPHDLADHLVVCDTGTTFPLNLEHFISGLRAPYRLRTASKGGTEPTSSDRVHGVTGILPIVILSKNEPDTSQLRLLQSFEQVYLVKGSALVRKDLFRARIHTAEKAVVLSGLNNQSTDVAQRTADSTALLAVLNIESLSQDDDFFIVVEFIHRENMKFVGESETVSIDELYAQAILRPSFMSGHVFAPCMLDTLICQTYYNNHILDIVKHFIFSHNVAKDFMDYSDTSNATTLQATPAELSRPHSQMDSPINNSSDDSDSGLTGGEYSGHMFLCKVPDRYIGRLYMSFFADLCRSHQAIALGLYRSVSHNKHPLWYVLVNPGPAMTLRRGDQVYCLAHQAPQW